MKGLGCVRAGLLLERRAAGLAAADALRLEEHLAGCARCSQDARMLDALRGLSQSPDGTLSAFQREQVIRGALAHAADRAHEGAPGARSRVLMVWGGSLAAAAVVGLGLGLSLRPDAKRDTVAARPPQVARGANASTTLVAAAAGARGDRVLAGQIELDGRTQGTGSALASGAVLRTIAGARVALAQATVELRPGTEVRWDGGAHSLQLEHGSLLADVDPRAHAPFTVRTAGFSVWVLGTRFEVTEGGVRVERGRVRVLGPDGRELAAALTAGQSFELAGLAAEPASAAREATPARGGARAHDARRAGELLREAQEALGARQVARARQRIDAALTLGSGAVERAEALSLRAECALVEGDAGAAIEAYLRVARAFGSLPAGENALFAAARLQADRGQREAAVQALERYLQRYPHGRFRHEAGARLQTLRTGLDRER